MLLLKTDEEVELLRNSNQLVSKTLAELARHIAPGITTQKLDLIAEEFIRDHRAVPGFKGYNDFPATLCTSVNNEVVHGIPSRYRLRSGDIVSIDCGVILDGFYGDSAFTFAVGELKPAVQKLLDTTRQSLEDGVARAVEGNTIGDIGAAVQHTAETQGYSVVRELVGHGLGKALHEPPEVPNYGREGRGPRLKKGMVICIEPMINMGTKDIYQMEDGWTIKTRDNMPSAHFEYAVAVGLEKPDVLTTFSFIDNILNA